MKKNISLFRPGEYYKQRDQQQLQYIPTQEDDHNSYDNSKEYTPFDNFDFENPQIQNFPLKHN